MPIVATIVLIAGAIWVLAYLYSAMAVLRLRKTGGFFTEHGFFVGGLLLLAAAPVIALVVYKLSGAVTFWGGGVHILAALLLFGAGWRSRRLRLNPEMTGSTLSFREKSALLMLFTLGIAMVLYFTKIWNASLEEAAPLFFSAMVLLVIVMIAGHTAIAVFHAPLNELDAVRDERDRAVELHSMRNAYYALTASLWVVPVIAVLSFPALLIAKIAFAILLLSEVVYYGSVVAYYRFGAD